VRDAKATIDDGTDMTMPLVAKSALAIFGAGLLGVVFLAWQTPAMALVLSAIRMCF
jgi:hypothetical protein